MDCVLSELISLIELIAENNSSPRNASQNTLAIAGTIVYNYKKGTESVIKLTKKVYKSSKKATNSSYNLYFLEVVFAHSK